MKFCNRYTSALLLVFFLATNAKRLGQAGEATQEHRDLQYVTAGWPGIFSTSFSVLCFSSHTTADVKGMGKVTMNQLKVGDQVLTSSGKYETVYAMAHRHPSKSAEFIQIYSSSEEDPLEMTEKHMIFLEGKPNPVPASNVKIGDQLHTLDGPRHVTKISKVTRDGIFNPLTADGTIVVNGIVASVYSALLSNHDWIEITGHKVMTHQSFFHKALKSYRYMCNGVSLELCKTNNERVGIVQFFAHVADHWTQQGEVYQVVSLSLFMALICLVDVILSPFTLIVTVASIAWLTAKKHSKKKVA